MKAFGVLFRIVLALSLFPSAYGAVPHLLNYQGRIATGGTNFSGIGQFKFALVGKQNNVTRQATATADVLVFFGGIIVDVIVQDGGTGYVTPPKVTFSHPTGSGAAYDAIVENGAVTGFDFVAAGSNYTSTVVVNIEPPPAFIHPTYWSNDGTGQWGTEPTQAVELNVNNGIYSVLLGDTMLANMTPIPADVFTNTDVYLRIWFNDGLNGFQQLAPDQRLATSAYALVAENVPDASITSAKLKDGAITSVKLAPGGVQSTALAFGSVGASQIAAGSITDAHLSPTANIDAGKITTGDLQATRLKTGSNHTLTSSALLATIAGGDNNTATAAYTAVGGGRQNSVSGSHGTVGGGFRNTVENSYATVGGGNNNSATALYATVSGGHFNSASGPYAAVGGGDLNAAVEYATVPGGYENTAAGPYSLAAGRRALAAHEGCFVWADSTDAVVASTDTNQFIVRARGGIWLGTNSAPVLTNGVFLNTSTGGYLSSGGVWTDNCDRNAKENFTPVDARQVLAKVAALPISKWNYRTEDPSVQHVGPVAQDFYSAFQTGKDDRHLAALDSAGVALAAIQGLHAELQARDSRISALEQTIAELKDRLDALQAMMPSPSPAERLESRSATAQRK